MICHDCRNGVHRDCRGGTWCPCQHRVEETSEAEEEPEPTINYTDLIARVWDNLHRSAPLGPLFQPPRT